MSAEIQVLDKDGNYCYSKPVEPRLKVRSRDYLGRHHGTVTVATWAENLESRELRLEQMKSEGWSADSIARQERFIADHMASKTGRAA